MREQDQFALQITSLNAAPPSSNAARWAASSSLVSIQLLTIFQKVRQGRRQVQDGIEFLHSGDLRGRDPGLMSVAAGLRHNDLLFRSDLRSTAADRRRPSRC